VSIDPETNKNNRSPRVNELRLQQNYRGSPKAMILNYNGVSKRSLLDREERDLINLAGNLSKEEIWERLEEKRFTQLKRAAVNL